MMTPPLPKEPYELHVRTVHLDHKRGKHFSMDICPPLVKGGPTGLAPSHYPVAHACVSSILPLLVREAGTGSQRPRAQARPGAIGSHSCGAGGRLGGTDHCSSDSSKRWNLEDVEWLLKGTSVHLKDTSTSLISSWLITLWRENSLHPSRKQRWWILQSHVTDPCLQSQCRILLIPSSAWHLHLSERKPSSCPSFMEPFQLDVRTVSGVLDRTLKPESQENAPMAMLLFTQICIFHLPV